MIIFRSNGKDLLHLWLIKTFQCRGVQAIRRRRVPLFEYPPHGQSAGAIRLQFLSVDFGCFNRSPYTRWDVGLWPFNLCGAHKEVAWAYVSWSITVPTNETHETICHNQWSSLSMLRKCGSHRFDTSQYVLGGRKCYNIFFFN